MFEILFESTGNINLFGIKLTNYKFLLLSKIRYYYVLLHNNSKTIDGTKLLCTSIYLSMIHRWFEFIYENLRIYDALFCFLARDVDRKEQRLATRSQAKKRVRRSFERGLYFREKNSFGLVVFCLSLPRSRRIYDVAKEGYRSV